MFKKLPAKVNLRPLIRRVITRTRMASFLRTVENGCFVTIYFLTIAISVAREESDTFFEDAIYFTSPTKNRYLRRVSSQGFIEAKIF